MNFFYPSLLIFIISLIVLYSVVPKFTPLIMAILAGTLLVFGIYHHYSLFKNEYLKTTWTDSLKMYAPAILIGFVLMLIFYGIFSFFSNGAVPVPQAPEIPALLSPPSPNKNLANTAIGSPITAAVNAVTNIATNVANTIGSGVSRVTSGVTNTINAATNTLTNTLANALPNVTANNRGNNKSIF